MNNYCLAIMQPYFLPYIGYFSLIKHVGEFIIFDTAQFIRHGWIERNRILKPSGGWQYIRVPLLKHSRETKILDVLVNNDANWEELIFAQLLHYKKKAPYYSRVIDLLRSIFAYKYSSIVELDYSLLRAVCSYVGINTPIYVFSTMNLHLGHVFSPDEWALQICKALGSMEYRNPTGGMYFFDRGKYEANGITLKFHKMLNIEYSQRREHFEPWLSIIDVMMFNSTVTIQEMLDNFELL